MQVRIQDRLLMLLRWLVAGIFLYAGIGKVVDPASFAENIDNYRLLPYFFVTMLAIILPWLEILCGILLLGGKFKTSAAFIALMLSFIFMIAIGSAVVRGLDIACGCFSVDSEATKVGLMRLIEDVFLFSAILLIYIHLINKRNVLNTA